MGLVSQSTHVIGSCQAAQYVSPPVVKNCSLPEIVTWPAAWVAACPPTVVVCSVPPIVRLPLAALPRDGAPGSSTSSSRPSASLMLRRCLPAWSVTVVMLPEYCVQTLLARQVVPAVGGVPSGGITWVTRPKASYWLAVIPSVLEAVARCGLLTVATRPKAS